jgi:hypothetical protein
VEVGLGKGVGVAVGVGKGVGTGLGKGVGVVKSVSEMRLVCMLTWKGEGAYRLLGL